MVKEFKQAAQILDTKKTQIGSLGLVDNAYILTNIKICEKSFIFK